MKFLDEEKIFKGALKEFRSVGGMKRLKLEFVTAEIEKRMMAFVSVVAIIEADYKDFFKDDDVMVN